MKKKMLRVLKVLSITVVVLLVLVVVGFSGYIGIQSADGLAYQNDGKETRAASVYQLEKWNFDQIEFEEKYQVVEMSITTEDHVMVPFATIGEGGFMADRNTAILVHGAGGDYVSTYPQAEIYLEKGWNVIAMDQRACGRSEEAIVSFGYYEQLDIKAIVDYVEKQSLETEIVLHGISMGAATVGIYGGKEHAENHIDAIIMDSSFDSMESMFVGVWDSMEIGLPSEYGVWCGDIALKIKYGFTFDDANVVKSLESCQVPVLIIQCEQDAIAPIEMGESLLEGIPHDQKEMWLVDCEHIEGAIDYPESYREKVFGYLDTY